jgi:hypothetical protein
VDDELKKLLLAPAEIAYRSSNLVNQLQTPGPCRAPCPTRARRRALPSPTLGAVAHMTRPILRRPDAARASISGDR